MKLDEVYQKVIQGRAILLTGSGAHIGALNLDKKEFPSGGGLSEELYAQCGIMNPEDPYDLQDASECYLENKSTGELIRELKNVLHVATINQEHRSLYAQNWQRVYTTNYDKIPILGTANTDQALYPVTLSDDTNLEKENKKQCVYINGYIEKLNENTLQSEFRLTGKSYDSSTYLNESPWGAIFSDDLTTADCIVIVGLSLQYDLDLRRHIYEENVKSKIVFIESKNITAEKKRKLTRYGEVYAISMQTFVQNLESYKSKNQKKTVIIPEHIYKCFDIAKKKTQEIAQPLFKYMIYS